MEAENHIFEHENHMNQTLYFGLQNVSFPLGELVARINPLNCQRVWCFKNDAKDLVFFFGRVEMALFKIAAFFWNTFATKVGGIQIDFPSDFPMDFFAKKNGWPF